MDDGMHFDTMATNTEQYGPNGVRMEYIQLTLIDTESFDTGWRKSTKGMDETVMEVALEISIDNNEGVKRRKN